MAALLSGAALACSGGSTSAPSPPVPTEIEIARGLPDETNLAAAGGRGGFLVTFASDTPADRRGVWAAVLPSDLGSASTLPIAAPLPAAEVLSERPAATAVGSRYLVSWSSLVEAAEGPPEQRVAAAFVDPVRSSVGSARILARALLALSCQDRLQPPAGLAPRSDAATIALARARICIPGVGPELATFIESFDLLPPADDLALHVSSSDFSENGSSETAIVSPVAAAGCDDRTLIAWWQQGPPPAAFGDPSAIEHTIGVQVRQGDERLALRAGLTSSEPTRPAVACGGGQFLIAWRSSANAADEVRAVRYRSGSEILDDPSGIRVASARRLESLAATFVGDHFLLAWVEELADGTLAVRAAGVSEDGDVSAEAVPPLGEVGETLAVPEIAIAAQGSRWLITYLARTQSRETSLRAVALESAGCTGGGCRP